MSKYFNGELLSGYEKNPKTTIFGEEHFIDTTMINLIKQKNNAIDNFVFEQMENVIKGSGFVQMPQVVIDKDKLKKWIVLCMKLENIEHSELVDMATKKKIADLEAKLAESEKKFIIANNLRKNSDEVLLNYKTEKYGLDKTIQELRKMKLDLPEKEWYYKGFENCERQMSSHIADLTLEVKELKQQLAEKDKILEQHKIDQLYLELLFTRLQWIHEEADKCREEKERFGVIEDMALDSVWRVLDLQKHECCGYEEMAELDDGIGYIAEDKLLITIEQDLNFKATRTENEIIDEIKQLTHQHEDKGE